MSFLTFDSIKEDGEYCALCCTSIIYFQKKNYPELEKDAESDRETLNNYCRDIENDIGREPVNVVMMRPPKDLNSPVTYSKPIPVKGW